MSKERAERSLKIKMEKCKWHGGTKLPSEVRGKCKKCEEDLQKTTDKLNQIFSGLVIDMDKDGNPLIYREK